MAKKENENTLPPALVASVRDQRAILFLGAGASLCAKDDQDQSMIGSLELKNKLCEHFLGDSLEGYPLTEAADIIIESHGQPVTFDYIKELLSPYHPSHAHRLIPSFRWRAIATTNYDLLIEQAYSDDKNKLQQVVPFVKNAEPIEQRMQQTLNPVQLLKLHGCLNHIQDEDAPLILTPDHYANYIQNRDRLFDRLKYLAHETPIIFCGYSLTDPHIRSLVSQLAPPEISRPSFYLVAPDITDMERDRWAKKHVTTVSMSFEEFMSELDQSISKNNRALQVQEKVKESPIKKHYRTHASESALLQKFLNEDALLVHPDMQIEEQKPQEFYRGNDNGWGAIQYKYDVPRKVEDEVLINVIEQTQKTDKSQALFILKGPAGNGKTIALKRIAWEASADLGQMVLWIDEFSALPLEAIEELYELSGKRIFLIIDRIAIHEDKVSNLLDFAKKKSIPITIIGAERDSEWFNYCARLENYKPKEFRIRYLSRGEIESLLDLLQRHNSLGLLKNKTREEQVKAFENSAERQLLVALHEVTLGKRFEDIVFEEYSGILPEEAQQLYLDICTLNQFGVSARAGTISRMSGIHFLRFEEELFAPLENIVQTRKDPYSGDRVYMARHSRVARFVFRCACDTPEERAEQFIRVIEALDLGYSSDSDALTRIIKGRTVSETIPDIEAARSVFESALALSEEPFLLQQWSILESTHDDGSLEKALDLIKEAYKKPASSGAITHTYAEVCRKLANKTESKLSKEQYRKKSRELLGEIKSEKNKFFLATMSKLLVDELTDLASNGAEKDDAIFIKKIKSAEEYISQGQQLFPDDSEFDQIDAKLREALAQKDMALAALERALAARGRNDAIAVRLGKAYREKGDKERSYKTLRTALESYPDSKKLHFAIARMMLEDQEEDTNMIEEHLVRSFDTGDSNHDARHLLAQFYFMAGRAKDAAALFKKIDANAPESFLPPYRPPISTSVIAKRLPKYEGIVDNKLESAIFIKSSSYVDNIYASEQSTDYQAWNEIDYQAVVEFEIGFNRRGPVAINVKPKASQQQRVEQRKTA